MNDFSATVRNRPVSLQHGARLVAIVLLTAQGGCVSVPKHEQREEEIDARRYSRDGVSAMDEGNWEQAERLFRDALALYPSDDRAQWGMAEVAWHRTRREQAIAHMENAVRFSGQDPSLLSRLGRMYFENGQLSAAETVADQILQNDSSHAAAWALTGDVLRQRGKPERALQAYHQALALQPIFPEVQLAVAYLYREQQRYDRLLATLDRMQDDVGNVNRASEVHHLRGIAMRNLGRPDEACRCFALAAKNIQPGSAHLPLLCDWAEAEWEAGDFVTARMTIGKALQLDPTYPRAVEFVARINRPNSRRIASDTPPAAAWER